MPTWVNGVLGAPFPADDPGLERGLNVFETFRTYGRSPFGFRQHMERLHRSCEVLGIEVPADLERELLSVCDEDVVVRVLLTVADNRVVRVYPVDQQRILRPVAVAPVDLVLPMGFAKHASRALPHALARRLGVEEVLFRDDEGFLLEGMRSNLFGVVDGVLVTPPADGRLLDGVTRGALLEVAERRGMPAQVRPLRLEECEELWLSSTLKELAPARLDGVVLDGPVGRALHSAFREERPRLGASRPD